MCTTWLAVTIILSTMTVHWTRGEFATGQPEGVIVYLMDWRYDDIAKECKNFLGPKGFAAVQVGPASENVLLRRDKPWFHDILTTASWYDRLYEKIPWYKSVYSTRPWYARYQPLSYKIVSGAGTEAEFASMVETCRTAGVKVYVDTVFNHMTQSYFDSNTMTRGIAGSSANTFNMVYPDVPYTKDDFNQPTCQLDNYNDPIQIRNCELNGMHDLNQTNPCVRDKMRNYLNELLELGVAGFRITHSDCMWPEDLQKLYTRLDFLNGHKGFGYEQDAFIYHDVRYSEQDVVKPSEYYSLPGLVTDYTYAYEIANAFLRKSPLRSLKNFGQDSSKFVKRHKSVVFVDNQFTQRIVTYTTPRVLTYKYPKLYKMAVAFMLASPHGQPLLMSSYFANEEYQGTPSTDDLEVLYVVYTDDGGCASGWICEHRWKAIYGMVQFRNTVGGEPVENWWDNNANQIAFSRGKKGFIAFNVDTTDLKRNLQTGLPQGTYCDVISGELQVGTCTGTSVTVGADGVATIAVPEDSEDGVIAIHVNAKLN